MVILLRENKLCRIFHEPESSLLEVVTKIQVHLLEYLLNWLIFINDNRYNQRFGLRCLHHDWNGDAIDNYVNQCKPIFVDVIDFDPLILLDLLGEDKLLLLSLLSMLLPVSFLNEDCSLELSDLLV
jgi:hypothetical protein